MNLYLLTQSAVTGWDTYDSAVVAAESEEAARMIHPGESHFWRDQVGREPWDGKAEEYSPSWPDASEVNVMYLGPLDETHSGKLGPVICASFNAS
jgi:hypothetical protein